MTHTLQDLLHRSILTYQGFFVPPIAIVITMSDFSDSLPHFNMIVTSEILQCVLNSMKKITFIQIIKRSFQKARKVRLKANKGAPFHYQ